MNLRDRHKRKSFRNLKTPKAQSRGKGSYKVEGVHSNVKVKRISDSKMQLQEGNGKVRNVTVKSKNLGRIKVGSKNKYILESKVTIDGKSTTFTCDMSSKEMKLPPEMVARVYGKQKKNK